MSSKATRYFVAALAATMVAATNQPAVAERPDKGVSSGPFIVSTERPGAEGGFNGYASGRYGGRIIGKYLLRWGGPKVPGVVVGCVLTLNTGPNGSPATMENTFTATFFYGQPGTPPDVCVLPNNWFVHVSGFLITSFCQQDFCIPDRVNLVGTSLSVQWP